MTDALGLLQISARVLAVGLLIRAVETLAASRELRRDGLLARPAPWTVRPIVRRLDAAISPAALAVAVLVLQAVAALATLILPITHAVVRAAAIGLLVAAAFGNRRFVTVRNASDVMTAIVQGGVAAAVLDEGDGMLQTVGLLFIALQGSVAYLAAGVTKLLSASWRSGRAIENVFGGTRYGNDVVAALVRRHALAPLVVAWGITVLELLLGISALLPTPVFLTVLAGGIVFHLSVAFQMRLYSFVWAFVATYPALYFLHTLTYR